MHRASAAVEGAGASRILPVVARGSFERRAGVRGYSLDCDSASRPIEPCRKHTQQLRLISPSGFAGACDSGHHTNFPLDRRFCASQYPWPLC